MENKIDFEISNQVIADVTQKLNEISEALQPYLIALTPEERRTIPKMSDKTLPFVEKTIDYCETASKFAPPYLNVADLKSDMTIYNQLTPLFRLVMRLHDGLDDTTMEAGAESYANSLSYYNSVKQAAKMNVPGAKAIYDDLKKRFERTASPEGDSGE